MIMRWQHAIRTRPRVSIYNTVDDDTPYPFWEPSSTVSTSPSNSRTGNVHVGKVLADDRAVREAVKVTSMTRMSAARNTCQNSVHVHQGILAIEQGGHEVDIPSDSARPHIPQLVAHRLRTMIDYDRGMSISLEPSFIESLPLTA